mmetsp:Transcript_54720/g.146490  ORF Transcript_54720/g.146490 Transcript_54720/m.146490 type:complete len:237 (-) Transcript_54720:46-756(-)
MLRVGVHRAAPEVPMGGSSFLHYPAVGLNTECLLCDGVLRLPPEALRRKDGVVDGIREHTLEATATRRVDVQLAARLGAHGPEDLRHDPLQAAAAAPATAVDHVPELQAEGAAMHLQGAARLQPHERGVRAIAIGLRLIDFLVEVPLVEEARLLHQHAPAIGVWLPLPRYVHQLDAPRLNVHAEKHPELFGRQEVNGVGHDTLEAIPGGRVHVCMEGYWPSWMPAPSAVPTSKPPA